MTDSEPSPFDTDALSAMLERCACKLVPDAHGPQAEPVQTVGGNADGFVSAIASLGVIKVQGVDKDSFLQGQLTNDIEQLKSGDAQWTGLCSPKGRLLATFLAVRDKDTIWLLVSRELAAAIAKRLAMYVLRAKVTVSDESSVMLAIGVAGSAGINAMDEAGCSRPDPMHADSAPLSIGQPPVIINDQLSPRFIVLCQDDEIAPTWKALSATLPVRESAYWRATEVISGIARVSAPIQESFVPQMINFELVGGVNFEKGCYTGQEVVARSQYLGKMKRRMFLASTSVTPAPGDDVLDDQGKATGTVVASGPGRAVGVDAESVVLFETRVDADKFQIDGQPLSPMNLPYDIPEPSPFKRPG